MIESLLAWSKVSWHNTLRLLLTHWTHSEMASILNNIQQTFSSDTNTLWPAQNLKTNVPVPECMRYGHFARECTFPANCTICAERHDPVDCKSTTNISKCINCVHNEAIVSEKTRIQKSATEQLWLRRGASLLFTRTGMDSTKYVWLRFN